ncbi:MAG: sulfite exporter TauE/SafE family protein [Candidatus Thalassarchaeaceae archaeon]|nr:sulfite exporter TauE/SafE family protein [Candidatus Thalassarchaeaceae archaeon]
MVSTELVLVLLALFAVAALYSSVGLGGGSGYLAVLSMTSFAASEVIWLKQYAWSLNLIVAGIAFWHYHRSGHHVWDLSIPFISASVPMAALGGFMLVEGGVYDALLSIALIVAAWRLVSDDAGVSEATRPSAPKAAAVGGGIGLASGVIGLGGGIFLLPALMLGRWGTAKEAAATTSLFVWLNSLAGLVGTGLAGRLDLAPGLLLPFASTVLVGGIIGSRYGAQVSSQRGVRGLLVVVLLLAATKRVLEIQG